MQCPGSAEAPHHIAAQPATRGLMQSHTVLVYTCSHYSSCSAQYEHQWHTSGAQLCIQPTASLGPCTPCTHIKFVILTAPVEEAQEMLCKLHDTLWHALCKSRSAMKKICWYMYKLITGLQQSDSCNCADQWTGLAGNRRHSGCLLWWPGISRGLPSQYGLGDIAVCFCLCLRR